MALHSWRCMLVNIPVYSLRETFVILSLSTINIPAAKKPNRNMNVGPEWTRHILHPFLCTRDFRCSPITLTTRRDSRRGVVADGKSSCTSGPRLSSLISAGGALTCCECARRWGWAEKIRSVVKCYHEPHEGPRCRRRRRARCFKCLYKCQPRKHNRKPTGTGIRHRYAV